MRFILLAFWLLVLAPRLPGADESLTGTWRLDIKRSKSKPSTPQIQVLRVASDHENLRITLDGLTQEGTPFEMTVKCELDDDTYSVVGVSFLDAVSGVRVDGHTILIRTIKSGHIERGTAATSKDGKTLRVQFFNGNGKSSEVTNIATFDKE